MISQVMILASRLLLYLDPGSGSLLLQLFLGALVGAGVAVKLFWKRIRGLFGGLEEDAGETDEEEF